MVSRVKVIAVLSCAILLLFPMMNCVAGLSDLQFPIRDDVLVVSFGSDEATQTATRIIENSVILRNDALTPSTNIQVSMNLPTSQIESERTKPKIRMSSLSVSCDDFENEMMNRKASVLVIIGHGSEEGIEVRNDCISWSDVTESIESVDASRTVLASCHSDGPASTLSNGFGFSGVVDARMAAYLSSALVLSSFDGPSPLAISHLSAGFNYGLRAATHGITPMPLGDWPPWWNPWKIASIVVLTTIFYTLSPITAPTTVAQCIALAAGVTMLGVVLTGLAWFIYQLASWAKPLAPPDLQGMFTALQNFASTVAGLIMGGIAAYLSGASYPGLLNFLRGLYALWIARAGAETATAACPEPISRTLLAISCATLLITGIEMVFNFFLSVTPPSPPPPPSVVIVPPSGGGGGGGGGKIIMR
ncbi:MAG: hypothetical protein ACFFBL_02675 [Promethearchaeota archaeon]